MIHSARLTVPWWRSLMSLETRFGLRGFEKERTDTTCINSDHYWPKLWSPTWINKPVNGWLESKNNVATVFFTRDKNENWRFLFKKGNYENSAKTPETKLKNFN